MGDGTHRELPWRRTIIFPLHSRRCDLMKREHSITLNLPVDDTTVAGGDCSTLSGSEGMVGLADRGIALGEFGED